VTEDVPMWRAFTGQSLEEATGMGWIFALHPDDRERTADVWLRAVRSNSFYDAECRIRRYDGEYRWMEVHGVPVLEADGAIREWVITCADMHDRKRTEEEVRKLNQELEQRVVERTAELEAANQELEAFAYSVSHDLRAPLRAVSGFSRILLEEYAPRLPAKAQHYLEAARKNAVQMGELIDDLLAFSQLSRQPLHKQPIAPTELVREVLQDLRPDREGRQVEITVGDLPCCEGDPRLLKQVLVNLLSNGFKYTRTREVARIEVGAMTASGGATPVYYVRDNGVGFDMRYADKLFGVFQRLHGTLEYPGTGVGLAIVQRIVHRHGGRVWAEAAVNQGATFYFVLGQGRPQQTKEELETCPINP
jgi:PAS domain S-box-containing protein